MGKRCSLGLFCFAVFIAFDPAFAQIEAVSEKDKPRSRKSSASRPARPFPWKTNIVTTVFWIGEQPGGNNLTPNRTSAWDKQWTKNYGGFDDPNPAHRRNYVPIKFIPQQNPFYCALPYNDKAHTGHRPEAPRVVPWFQEAYQGPAVSTCKDRWIAIRKGNRIAYGSGKKGKKRRKKKIRWMRCERQSNRLCAVGRRRTIPNGPLAIRIWQ